MEGTVFVESSVAVQDERAVVGRCVDDVTSIDDREVGRVGYEARFVAGNGALDVFFFRVEFRG